MALSVGSRLGHYDVTALIGEGGMGQVYQATDTTLNRQVALKVMLQAFTDVYRLRVLGQWFDGIRFYAAASSPRRSRRTWAGLR